MESDKNMGSYRNRQGPNRQIPPLPGRQGNLRPGSATVAGNAARFHQNMSSKRRIDPLLPSSSTHGHMEDIQYSYQQPLMNNLMMPNRNAKQSGSASK